MTLFRSFRPGLVLRLFRSSARIQGKRMALTVAALAWGTLAIVLLLSFGEGLKRSLAKGRHGLGEGIMIVWPGETQKPWAGFPAGRSIKLHPEDVELVIRGVPAITAASGEMRSWNAQLAHGRTNLNKRVTGVTTAYGELRSQVPEAGGRFLDELDQRLKRRVIFLGDEIKHDLFGDAPAVGETVLVNRAPFTVVGVLRKKLQMGTYGGPDAANSLIPLTTFETFFGRRELSNLVFKPERPALMPAAKRGFYEVLGAKYGFDPTDERALGSWDTLEGERIVGNMMLGIQIFLGIIGGLTLVIGGVGVANIMYAVVKHRTREVAIQMAMGARRAYVIGPLVVESLAMTLAGGALGTGVGLGIIRVLGWLQSQAQSEAMEFLGRPTFSLPVAVTTVTLLGSIGFLAGYFPARRAASIHPARTLRAE